MNLIDKTNNKKLQPAHDFGQAIDRLPDDLAVWCFSGLLRLCDKSVTEQECIARLRKLWCDIPVYLVTKEMADDEMEDETGKFVIPDPMFGRNTDSEVADKEKRKCLYDMLTSTTGYRGESRCMMKSRNKGYGVWVTPCHQSTYTREFPLDRGYDETGTQARVFVWTDCVMDSIRSSLQRKNQWNEESERRFYNQWLTIVTLKSKFEAMLDIDLTGNMFKVERNHTIRKLYPHFYKMRNGGLAAGLALYVSNMGSDMKALNELVVMGGDSVYRIGYSYLQSHNALFESTRLWMDFKRRMCFGKMVSRLFAKDPRKSVDDICSTIEEWMTRVWGVIDKGCDAPETLLPLDYEMAELACAIRDENSSFGKLSDLHIPNCVNELMNYLFSSCYSLKEIFIHNNLKINTDALFCCKAKLIKE